MSTFPANGPVRLRTNLADSALSKALKTGEVSSDLVEFDFCGPATANQGFKPMVREGKFDAGELAIVTYMQALDYGKPLVLLPATMVGRFQHQFFVCRKERAPMDPKTLEGKRVAVRSYTQTTGVWVRGVLQDEYDVDLNKLKWVCWDDPHLAEYTDPASLVERAGKDKSLNEMALAGEVDAAIPAADLLANPDMRTVVENPDEAGRRWGEKYGCGHINHMFAVHRDLPRERPDVVREIYRVLAESKARAGLPKAGEIDQLPFGFEACRKSLELITRYAYEQKIVNKLYKPEDLFDDVTIKLGA
ncbi:MAG: 4,5-dihydroxyphthalate decarboxylase [Hyphomicrobiales bacterium]|nr:4,5-dihydroxyphthalate decarboxylase [Hyphomicrobiales bacterium]